MKNEKGQATLFGLSDHIRRRIGYHIDLPVPHTIQVHYPHRRPSSI
jgi:hypothetical protein